MNSREIVTLMKEKEGLKLGYFKYKRKYKALNRILVNDLASKIHGLGELRIVLMRRIHRSEVRAEIEMARSLLKFIGDEKAELQAIYDKCIEATKD